jgi:MFS family permease
MSGRQAMSDPQAAPIASATKTPLQRPRYRLLRTLEHSQKEAVASSAMTSSCENFTNAFALHLGASNLQMGFLTGMPQLLGSMMQLISVWIGSYLSRRRIVLFAAILQTLLMFAFATLAALQRPGLVQSLIMLVMLYHATSNLIQPQWRAWMGSLVPQKQRGRFFASRTKLTIATSLGMFLLGGILLTLSARFSAAWVGFFFLFFISAIGRAFSCYFLWSMHDPHANESDNRKPQFFATLGLIGQSMRDKTFRNYTFFVAGMQGAVGISGPFFAVYMLEELHYTYLEYSINLMASIATQFTMLRYWGKVSDSHGNRFIMLLCSSAIPVIPLLWLISDNYYWLLVAQLFSGLAWSGFNLTTANYLYDIRPHHTDFATYAASQAGITAVLVFIGSIAGGYLAHVAPGINNKLPVTLGSALFIVFIVSALLRAAVLLWFIPRAEEPQIRTRPQLLQIIFRIARYNSISGVALDWMTVTEKERKPDEKKAEDQT